MGKLKFLADMNISPLTVKQLRQQGWDIHRVSELMADTTPDSEILEYARTRGQVIITQDLDFTSLLAIGGYAAPSVISLRIQTPRPEHITQRICDVIAVLSDELEQGIIVSVDEKTLRYRTLPMKTD